MPRIRKIKDQIFKDKKYFDIRSRLKWMDKVDIAGFVGWRGMGKSYSAKNLVVREAVSDYLRTGDINKVHKFVWINKSFENIKTGITSWADELHFRDGLNLEVNKSGIFLRQEVKHVKKRSGEEVIKNKMIGQIGFWAWLSTPAKFKSIVFEGVYNIVLDEFIDEFDKYLVDEPSKFMSIISSIARHRKVRIILIANNVKPENPYFNFFGIGKDDIPEWDHAVIFQKGKLKIGLNMVGYSDWFAKQQAESTSGLLMEGTKYGDYSMHGNWLEDNSNLVLTHPNETLSTKWNIKLLGQEYEILKYGKYGYYIRSGRNKGNNKIIYLTQMDADNDGQGNRFTSPDWLVYVLRSAGIDNRLFFSTIDVKDTFVAWLSKFK